MHHSPISTFVSRAVISLLLLLASFSAEAQSARRAPEVKDTLRTFRGLQLMADLAGALQRTLSDYGQYEAGLRVNLRDRYFPIFELGYGSARHDDDPVTHVAYKTAAPYFRLGLDFNILRNRHDIYRTYVGLRYAFTHFRYDVTNPFHSDPVWQDPSPVSIAAATANCHWMELLFAVDAKIWGPVHLGWSARYRRRITHRDGPAGNVWYVPGYGKSGTSRLGATFNLILNF